MFNNLYQNNNDNKVSSISAYSYVAESDKYFIADYVPLFDYNRKFINTALASTQALANLVATEDNNNNSNINGNTFAIKPTTPETSVTFNYLSSVSTILSAIDKNNNLIGLGGTGLTTYSKDLTIEDAESFDITTKQAEDISNSVDYGENGIKLITENLANITVKAGYFDAISTYLNNYNGYDYNKYKTLYDNDLVQYLAEVEALKNAKDEDKYTPIISYNDLLVSLINNTTD